MKIGSIPKENTGLDIHVNDKDIYILVYHGPDVSEIALKAKDVADLIQLLHSAIVKTWKDVEDGPVDIAARRKRERDVGVEKARELHPSSIPANPGEQKTTKILYEGGFTWTNSNRKQPDSNK